MPTYHYKCKLCDKITECVKRMTDAPPKSCQHCGHPHLVQCIRHANFHLKGQGWFVDGYQEPIEGSTQ